MALFSVSAAAEMVGSLVGRAHRRQSLGAA